MNVRYRGETISFDIEGTGGVDLTTLDFAVYLYCHRDNPTILRKQDALEVSPGRYRCTLPAKLTARMDTGRYGVEVFLEGEKRTSICVVNEWFTLADAVSKAEVI